MCMVLRFLASRAVRAGDRAMPDGIAEFGGLRASVGASACPICWPSAMLLRGDRPAAMAGAHLGFRMDRPLWAVVPVKDLQHAKQRLAGALSAAERRGLFAAMLEDVLAALAASERLAGILVVTRDVQAQNLAARYEARGLIEPANRGPTPAS